MVTVTRAPARRRRPATGPSASMEYLVSGRARQVREGQARPRHSTLTSDLSGSERTRSRVSFVVPSRKYLSRYWTFDAALDTDHSLGGCSHASTTSTPGSA